MARQMLRKGQTETSYNAYKEFFDRESEAHVLAKWMNFAGINNIEGLILGNLLSLAELRIN